MSTYTALLICILASSVESFSPQSLITKAAVSSAAFVPSSVLQNENFESSVIPHSAFESSFAVLAEGGAMDILRNVAVAITAVVFLLAGITLVTASIIIPAAAKELEKECKELAPELWDEYQGLLEPGQTIAQRPELMQELGAKLQPLLDAKMEREFAAAKEKGIDVSEDERAWKAIDSLNDKIPQVKSTPTAQELDLSAMKNQWDDDDDSVIDAEVIGKDKK